MLLSINDFRCFHRVTDIPVRPINVLVGENSSGKSSLLAATRMIFDLFGRDEKLSFNKDPFFLGSYEQIAHYRGGRFGRAKEFSFVTKGEIDRARVGRRRRARQTSADLDEIPSNYELHVQFINNRSQPATSKINFISGAFTCRADFFGEEIKVLLQTPGNKGYEFSDRFGSRTDSLIVDFSYLDFVLRDLRFVAGEADKLTKEFFDEVQLMWELFADARRGFRSRIYASAPVRSEPERTYNPGEAATAPSGEHIPFVLAQIKAFDKELWTEVVRTLSSFGKASGLFEGINIKPLAHTEGGPFQLIVTLSGAKSNIIDVGYGVSQALPIITDLARAKERTVFLFQQPEVHLHPRAQAELGTFFAQMVQARKHTLFIETHSDHLIDRIRIEARDAKHIKPEDVSILFFEKRDLDVIIHPISIDSLGNVRGAPKNYRQFFINEEFKSLGVEVR